MLVFPLWSITLLYLVTVIFKKTYSMAAGYAGNSFHYPHFPNLVVNFFFAATITSTIFP